VRPGIDVPGSLTRLARVAAAALEAADAHPRASLALIFSDDRELAALNSEHMGHDGPTDVLSFPLLADIGQPFALPPHRRPHLGDVILSVERAAEQAREGRGGQTGDVRWSVQDELALLVVHGTLHVCGWDHATPAEEAAMRSLENAVLGRTRQPQRRASSRDQGPYSSQ
jgi:probable rRNA maturation factor